MKIQTTTRGYKMADAPKKGVAGVGTGAKTRAAISEAQKNGCSLAEIGKLANRDPSVISAIKSGKIKNPPADVATDIQKGCKSAMAARNGGDEKHKVKM